MDGVLHEFDERGGFRFWGTKRRFHSPAQAWRARRAAKRERKRAEGAGWERWSHAVQRRPWLAASVALVVLLGLALPGDSACAWARATRASIRPGTTTRKAYDLIAEGFGAGHERLVPARRRAGPEGRQGGGAADRRRGQAPTRTSPSSRRRRSRRTGRWPRSPPTRGPGPQEAATTDTLKRLRDDVVPAVERETGARVEVGGFTASNEDFSQRGGRASCRSSSASSCCSARCCCSSCSARWSSRSRPRS